ncbi:MAG: Asp-tRNA(Asn)/Glu-tRNA(Gln) amidotransferase GatCAB subunit B, partial [Anaerolineales bacterium]
LPQQRRARFAQQYGLPIYDADILTSERSLSEYYEATLQAYAGDPKRVSNWIINDLMRMINELGIIAADLKVTPAYLAQIIRMVDENTINISTGKTLLDKVQNSGKDPAAIVAEEGLAKLSDADALEAMIQKLVAENPQQVENYRRGKTGLLGWFVGQVMKQTQGKADAQLTRSILEKYLNP